MAEKIKKHKDILFVIGIGLGLTVAGIIILSELVAFPNSAWATTASDTVAVTAYVRSWMTISVSPNSVTLSPDLVNTAGGLGVGSSSNIALQVGTNSSLGWSITISSVYGALASSSAATPTIQSVPTGATTSIIAGVDGYGANATNAIANVIIGAGYGNWGFASTGALSSSSQPVLMYKSSANSSTTVGYVKVYAAATSTKPTGTYTDTIILTATSQ